ncbi:SRPBCC domain-containing protein [Exiguobacterium artemiae]|uniref:SRPBCC domain-containing protein n=1 Tax=Exiguobacterium artemiae TaxID=340145 RepID=UPI0002FC98F7|nr:SRPBCC domain-containing protein [Exiguobacterium sibiricum]
MQEKLKTKVDGSILQMEWTFNAPRELVFAAFTEKEYLEAWWGPEGWQTEITTFDFVEGGIWHYCMRCKDPAQGNSTEWSRGEKRSSDKLMPRKVTPTPIIFRMLPEQFPKNCRAVKT